MDQRKWFTCRDNGVRRRLAAAMHCLQKQFPWRLHSMNPRTCALHHAWIQARASSSLANRGRRDVSVSVHHAHSLNTSYVMYRRERLVHALFFHEAWTKECLFHPLRPPWAPSAPKLSPPLRDSPLRKQICSVARRKRTRATVKSNDSAFSGPCHGTFLFCLVVGPHTCVSDAHLRTCCLS